jgi:hypothetical protein
VKQDFATLRIVRRSPDSIAATTLLSKRPSVGEKSRLRSKPLDELLFYGLVSTIALLTQEIAHQVCCVRDNSKLLKDAVLRPTHGYESALLRLIDSKQVTRDFRRSVMACGC